MVINNLLRAPEEYVRESWDTHQQEICTFTCNIQYRETTKVKFSYTSTFKMSVFVALICYVLRNYPNQLIRTVFKLHGPEGLCVCASFFTDLCLDTFCSPS